MSPLRSAPSQVNLDPKQYKIKWRTRVKKYGDLTEDYISYNKEIWKLIDFVSYISQ
jgi:hypothetical protein